MYIADNYSTNNIYRCKDSGVSTVSSGSEMIRQLLRLHKIHLACLRKKWILMES